MTIHEIAKQLSDTQKAKLLDKLLLQNDFDRNAIVNSKNWQFIMQYGAIKGISTTYGKSFSTTSYVLFF